MNKIKLIAIDFYGVLLKGSYVDTCRWIARKYRLPYEYCYHVVYHKYFAQAALGKITEKESFALAAAELGLKEDWRALRARHISFQKLNQPVFNLCRRLQQAGYKLLLLSKNTHEQFDEALRREHIRRYFKHIINTLDLKLPKASPATMKHVLRKFKVKPSEVVFIDDQDFNLVAAQKMGVKTILYKNFSQSRSELRRYINYAKKTKS